jgi:hypothetical protein
MRLLKKPMPRRTFLRGLGASISLPVLDVMTPALGALSKPGSAMPLRVGYVYSPNGIIKERWRPTIAGADFELTDVLQPWEPFRDQLLVLTHLNNGDAESVSGHVGGSTMFLTGTEPNKSLSEIQANQSVDQLLAREIGGLHRKCGRTGRPVFRRLQLRLHEHHILGESDDAAADGAPAARDFRAAVW